MYIGTREYKVNFWKDEQKERIIMKKKRILCLFLAMSLLLGLTACGGQGSNKEELKVTAGTPSYEDDKQIELAAYCGPRREGYRYWNGTYGTHPDDQAGGWEGWMTEEDFQAYIDCGFTYLLPETDAAYDHTYKNGKNQKANSFEESDLYPFMETAERMGIPVVVLANQLTSLTSSTDYRLSDENKAFLSQMVEDLSKYKSFKGFTFRDEPNIESVKAWGAVKDYLDGLNPNLFYFTSLLPIYCDDLTRLTTKNTDNVEVAYNEYVDAFSDAGDTFAYDNYPLWADPIMGTTSIDATWFQNLRLVAESAKEKDYDAGITIQATAFGPKDGQLTTRHNREITSKADVAFQMYSSLAYGMKNVTYYTYWQHWMDGDSCTHYSAMVNYPTEKGGEPIKTDAYYAVQEVNTEIKKFDHVFMNFDWEGTMSVVPKGKKASTALSQVGDYQNPRIASVFSTDEAIIGCMKDTDGYDGYWIVNATDPGQNLSNSVTVEFKQATKAIAYVLGEETEITLKDGKYTFDLTSGEGVFVIPIQ